jgi:nucleoside-diphosphate-sugar epimerase
MPRAVVTGGLGGAASWVVSSLADQGWDVRSIDFDRPAPGTGPKNVDFRAADLTDQGSTWELVTSFDPDHVIHFAAYPNPLGHAGAHVYKNNTMSTYNVLSAAGSVGADVVWASSETVYGTVFADPSFLPDYFPIDVDHPLRPEDPYATAKVSGEEVAKMMSRRHGISIASVRPSWINYPGEYHTSTIRENFDPETADLDSDFGITFHKASGNFFSYVDIRDVVSLVETAMASDFEGHEAFMAVAANNLLGMDTLEAVEAVYGGLPEQCDISGEESALSSRNAKEVLGWEPEHSWREAETESVEGPSFL